MSILDFRPRGDIWTGVAIGLAVLAAPIFIPMVAAAAKPILKTGIKTGYLVYDKTCEIIAEAKESMEDLAAEAKAEVASQSDQTQA